MASCEWSKIKESQKMEGRRGKLVRQLATSSSPSPPLASSARWCLAWHYTIFLRYLDWEMMIKTEIKISITEIIYIVGRPTRQCLPDLGFWRQPLTAKVRRLFWKNVMSAFRWLIVKNPIYENPCTRCQHQLIRGANHKTFSSQWKWNWWWWIRGPGFPLAATSTHQFIHKN